MSRNLKILRKTIIALAIIIILFGFTETANLVTGNWYQQFMPNLNNMPISDIFFLDSLTGWAVTNNNLGNDSGYILKTINSGDNWTVKLHDRRDFGRVKFINQNTGFVCGGTGSGTSYLYKSTDSGENWFIVSGTSFANFFNDMSVLSIDTMWLAEPDGLIGGVFRTTNGGVNWTQQFSAFNNNPSKIYMYNARIGFINNYSANNILRRTTDGGASWTQIIGENGFLDIKFVDSLTGWKANGTMKKTTNGGLNWVQQTMPFGGIILGSGINKISVLNQDTIWGVGGEAFYGSGQFRGILFRTTNGGQNWLFQVPDTTIHLDIYTQIQFINRRIGWAYRYEGGIHTTTGGDTNWLTGIKQISSEVPKQFKLFQNYPNPFNPATVISYQLRVNSFVKLIVYDIQGREVTTLVNQKQNAGTYQVDFSGNNCSSGVYFYSLYVDDKLTETKKMLLIK